MNTTCQMNSPISIQTDLTTIIPYISNLIAIMAPLQELFIYLLIDFFFPLRLSKYIYICKECGSEKDICVPRGINIIMYFLPHLPINKIYKDKIYGHILFHWMPLPLLRRSYAVGIDTHEHEYEKQEESQRNYIEKRTMFFNQLKSRMIVIFMIYIMRLSYSLINLMS